jgi:hypothetical protein
MLILYVYGSITLYGVAFQKLPLKINIHVAVLQPQHCLNNTGLGCSPFARHY